jgi:hypothetical protein
MAKAGLRFDAQTVPDRRRTGHRAGLAIDDHQAIAAAAHEAKPPARSSVLRRRREDPVTGCNQGAGNCIRIKSGNSRPVELKLKRVPRLGG